MVITVLITFFLIGRKSSRHLELHVFWHFLIFVHVCCLFKTITVNQIFLFIIRASSFQDVFNIDCQLLRASRNSLNLTILILNVSCFEISVDPGQLASQKPADQDLH